jgi:dipeptidase D
MIVGSAGGINITGTIGYKAADTEAGDKAVKVTLKGLKGGHSGLEINEGRANANKQMVRFVREAISQCDARLAEWHGGNMRNAIPNSCIVILTVPADNVEALKELVEDWKVYISEDYYGIEEGIEFFAEDVATPATEVPADIQDNLVDAIYACHDGVIRMIPSIPSKVETSSNLAIVDITDTKAEIKVLARSSSESMKDYIVTTVSSAFSMVGMKVETDGDYTGWNPNPNSPMVALMSNIYKDLFGTEPTVQVCHAGLECSIILGKYPQLDIVSFGPTIRSPHTPGERAHIPSVPKFWQFLTKTLEEIPVKVEN